MAYLYEGCFFRSCPARGTRFDDSVSSSSTVSSTMSLLSAVSSSLVSRRSSAAACSEMVGTDPPSRTDVDVQLLLLVTEHVITTSSNMRQLGRLQQTHTTHAWLGRSHTKASEPKGQRGRSPPQCWNQGDAPAIICQVYQLVTYRFA